MKKALQAAALVLGVLGAAAVGSRIATSLHGEVTDAAGDPIRGADVVLFRSDGVITVARTDDNGWYRMRFAPGSRNGSMLAACASGRDAIVNQKVEPVVWRADFGLSASSLVASRMVWPDELRNRPDLPQSCQLPTSVPQS